MADIFSKERRSQVMSLIKSKNTKPELALRKLVSSNLYPLGYRYRIHYKKLRGKPDITFVAQKIAIFVDGTFWHGYDFKNRKKKLPNEYWLSKIAANIGRDKKTNRELKKSGWRVIRIWEHDLRKNPQKVLALIRQALSTKT
jgi:DNA mismatch endonuclease (patch repair protein)